MILLLTLIEEDGDKEKFLLIYNTYKYRMFSIAYRILQDRGLAEDATQDSFLYLAKNIRKLDSDITSNKSKNYIFIVTKHKSLDIKRKVQKHLDLEFKEMTFAAYPNPESPESTHFRQQEIKDIIIELQNMPVTYRECLELNILYGIPPREIAKLLNLNRNLVRKRVSRGKKVLREILKRDEK